MVIFPNVMIITGTDKQINFWKLPEADVCMSQSLSRADPFPPNFPGAGAAQVWLLTSVTTESVRRRILSLGIHSPWFLCES